MHYENQIALYTASRHLRMLRLPSSRRPYRSLPRTVPMLVPQRWSDTGRSVTMNPNINYYGIVILLRKLRECGIFTEKELRKIAARIAADNGVEVMFFL